MENPALPWEVMREVHHDLTRVHRWLGNTAAIVRALRRDPLPVRRVLDVGCGSGGVLLEIRKQLGVEVVGVDLRPPAGPPLVPILQGDAVSCPLPPADVAIALCLAHHLTEADFIALIRNVGRSCRRFLVLDLVRHPLPLALFRLFVAPWVHPVNASDGAVSIQRSYLAAEMGAVVRRAVDGTAARVRHTVAPLLIRQLVDIDYRRANSMSDGRDFFFRHQSR